MSACVRRSCADIALITSKWHFGSRSIRHQYPIKHIEALAATLTRTSHRATDFFVLSLIKEAIRFVMREARISLDVTKRRDSIWLAPSVQRESLPVIIHKAQLLHKIIIG